jgi:hypothetical protein
MSKMSRLHAEMVEANGGVDPSSPDDIDWDAPAGLVRHQRVKAGTCQGWVEVIESGRVGVRLVNGNFRWYDPANVRSDNHGFGDFAGEAMR